MYCGHKVGPVQVILRTMCCQNAFQVDSRIRPALSEVRSSFCDLELSEVILLDLLVGQTQLDSRRIRMLNQTSQ